MALHEKKMRADVYLTENGYAPSRGRARLMIESGSVTVDGVPVKKPAQEISDGAHTVVVEDPLAYVSRGGLKLEGALDAFGIDVQGLTALDVGASTGGFTDCLLQRGAARVHAIDAGERQLAKKLCKDARVISREHLNARELTPADVGGERIDLIVMDVSFISATYIIPRFPVLLGDGGEAIILVKPQFEVGKAMLGKGGIVKEPAAHRYAIERVCECATAVGLLPVGLIPSPITGGDGNREFLLRLCTKHTKNLPPLTPQDIRRVADRISTERSR